MAERALLTVPQVAEQFQVTPQTIRNWIEHGALPAVRVGRAFRVRRGDVDELLERAQADNTGLATRRDQWAPNTFRLPTRPRANSLEPSIWDGSTMDALPRKRPGG